MSLRDAAVLAAVSPSAPTTDAHAATVTASWAWTPLPWRGSPSKPRGGAALGTIGMQVRDAAVLAAVSPSAPTTDARDFVVQICVSARTDLHHRVGWPLTR